MPEDGYQIIADVLLILIVTGYRFIVSNPVRLNTKLKDHMLDDYAVRFLYAAESLAYFLAGWAWWRVWQDPTRSRLSAAAVCTAVGFCIKFIRISVAIVMR